MTIEQAMIIKELVLEKEQLEKSLKDLDKIFAKSFNADVKGYIKFMFNDEAVWVPEILYEPIKMSFSSNFNRRIKEINKQLEEYKL